MKIGKILNNIISEKITKKELDSLKKANSSTYPKIPVSAIFFHDVPDMETILKSTKNGNNDLNNNNSKKFKLETVNVKMIVPTQKNVNADNLKTTDNLGEDTNAELVKYGQFYFIIDGHHRIANAILQGLDEIEAYVYTDKGLTESILDEDYPVNFNMDEFKELNSFNARIKYCQDRLKRISSGSSRIVYQIDDEKVLKLAKNKKGIAQNGVEISYSRSDYPVSIMFDYEEENDLWVEMELAKPINPKIFFNITGFKWEDYVAMVHNYGEQVHNNGRKSGYQKDIDPSVVEAMWDDDDFVREMLNFIGDTGVPVGDLQVLSSYGLVKRDGYETIVVIDYGLTHDVYDSYYS